MNINLPSAALLALLASACTSGSLQAVRNEDTLNGYASAIRWGEFEKAQDFQNPAHRARLDLAWLKNIHIASYNVLYKKEERDSHVLEQTVEIRYFNEQIMVEKILTDRQIWHFYEDRNKYMLETDLPAFQ
ncbi:MAG: hypothetical protein ACKN9T_03810 [Candidatus Methylumidiphilus sp.]